MPVSRRNLLLAPALAVFAGCSPDRAGTTTAVATTTHSYGADPKQVADLHVPAGAPPAAGWPVVVLVHGGYWSRQYDRSLQDDVLADLVGAGLAVWNVEYRSIGNGGGWPITFTDVGAACDLLPTVAAASRLDVTRVVLVGHSAGGTLALWAAARRDATLRPVGVVSQAGVDDLVAAAEQGLGGGAVAKLLGGDPEEIPDVYAAASPMALLPVGVPTLVITGTEDTMVPISQSTSFAAAATAAGDVVELRQIDGEDHFDVLDAGSRIHAATRTWAQARVRG
ncbi:alpha/beta fold hydrolase [Nakamurella sp. YIM 132087]|uniref:Alpha/beta fold hydrolase n=1 Tax=Nakamurella alba TaxID=2665158 RepID=A0A7K1FKY9_9ACTN|nr:alpha/beta fold hydrolase [Nakamurella alba]MTD14817.1 alpha/beta fold hydrolase [Nakamurella alba]